MTNLSQINGCLKSFVKVKFYNAIYWLFRRSRVTFNLKGICLLVFVTPNTGETQLKSLKSF